MSQRPLERFLNGILPENPVYRQLLGTVPHPGRHGGHETGHDHGGVPPPSC